ncbi:MAG: DUF262 domain-containing protein [Rhodomicrobium sp.]
MPSELLKNLLGQADANRLVLPDFQRDFVWKPADVTKLVASLLNRYPIGGLLFMESAGLYGQRPLDGVAPVDNSAFAGDSRLILDGQQRLTSCYRVFFGGTAVERYPGRYYFDYGKFVENPELRNSEIEELIYFIREKEVKKTLTNTAQEHAKGLFPLDIILREARGTNYSRWLSDYTFTKSAGDSERHARLSEIQAAFIRRFVENVTGYQVHYEEIKKDTSSDVICTVFETINTTGKRLTVFDLLVARCFPHSMNLRDMLEAALERPSIKRFDPAGEGIAPTAIPRIIALKDKETAKRADILDLPPDTIRKHWNYAVDALESALNLMIERYGCFGERFVPLADMIAPMAVVIASEKFNKTDEHLNMLDKWYWRATFSQYYISAPETKMQRTVRHWLSSMGWLDNPKNEPESVREFSWRTTLLEDVSRVDNAIYRGVISLLLSRKVRDFGPHRSNLATAQWEQIEDHHIYPKRFLAPYGIKGDMVNNIFNRTPLLRETNSAIGNMAPHVYLRDTKVVGTTAIEPILDEHLICPNIGLKPFTEELYREFRSDRTKRILSLIENVVGTPPQADIA